MNAEILAVGDELLSGEVTDTNSPFIEDMLFDRHLTVRRVTLLPDDEEVVARALEEGAERGREALEAGFTPQVLIVTGGLGPTRDDITRQAVAAAAGKALEFRREALEHIARRFNRKLEDIPEENKRQAFFPEGSKALPNPNGTAQGFATTVAGIPVYVLPGVPHELKAMLCDSVLPRLGASSNYNYARARFYTQGKGESTIAGALGELMDRGRNPLLGTLAHKGMVIVKVCARAETPEEAAGLLDETTVEIRSRLGDAVVCEGLTSLEETLLNLARERNLTIAVAESCTGGLLGAALTSVPGSSEVFRGGVIAYSNELKEELLGVPAGVLDQHGAVSAPVAEAMAAGVLKGTDADLAAAITGIAGPGGGTQEKPAGLVYIGIATSEGAETHEFRFRGMREVVRQRSVSAALALLVRKTRSMP